MMADRYAQHHDETPSEGPPRTDFDPGSASFSGSSDDSGCCSRCWKCFCGPKEKKTLTEQQIKLKKGLTVTLTCLGFILNIVSLIMAIQAWLIINDYTNEFDAIVATWEKSPVTDIILTTSSCPAGYWDQAAQVSYPGIYDACNCEKQNNPNKTYSDNLQGYCSSEQEQWNCESFDGINGFNVPMFSDPTVHICMTNSGATALQRQDYDDGCPNGYQVCGNASNPNEFVFCWSQNTSCPLTDWLIMDVENATVANMTAIELDSLPPLVVNKLAVFYKRGGAFNINGTQRTTQCTSPPNSNGNLNVCPIPLYGFPITDVATQSAVPCYLGKGSGWPGRSGFYSNAESTWRSYTAGGGFHWRRGYQQRNEDSGCSQNFDNRYIPVYARTERDLWINYTAAQFAEPSRTSHQLPYPYLTTDTSKVWYLTYRTEVEWQNGCSVSRERVQNNNKEVDSLHSAQAALIALTVIAFIFCGFFGCYLNIFFVMKDNDGNIEKGEEGYVPLCALKICKYFMQAGMYSCVIASVILAFGLVAFFRDLTDATIDGASGCTDTVTEGSFSHLKSIVDDLSKKDMIQGFSNLFDFFAEIGHAIVRALL